MSGGLSPPRQDSLNPSVNFGIRINEKMAGEIIFRTNFSPLDPKEKGSGVRSSQTDFGVSWAVSPEQFPVSITHETWNAGVHGSFFAHSQKCQFWMALFRNCGAGLGSNQRMGLVGILPQNRSPERI